MFRSKRQLAAVDRELLALMVFPQQQDKGNQGGDQVAEKALLDARQVAGEPDETAHQREAEGGGEDAEDPLGAAVHGIQDSFFKNSFIIVARREGFGKGVLDKKSRAQKTPGGIWKLSKAV